MSTAYYPQGMRPYGAGGFAFGSTLMNIPAVPWKATGVFANPVGVTATHIRPLTNKDSGNVFPTGFGLPRPIKHYRKGTVIPILAAAQEAAAALGAAGAVGDQVVAAESAQIAYNVNRAVKSSTGSSLGGGNGGTGLISQLIDMPGSFVVKENRVDSQLDVTELATGDMGAPPVPETGAGAMDAECRTCTGVGLVSGWYPINNLTEKPQPNVTNPLLCCNQQRKARRRVLPASTLVKKNYYQTTGMYLYNRCQTFEQRQFNFVVVPPNAAVLELFASYPPVTAKLLALSKPGDPLSLANYYVAQCNPNFTIETGAEIAFLQSLAKQLVAAGFLTQEQVTAILVGDLSVASFIAALRNTLTPEQFAVLTNYLYQVAADSYNGAVITGPSNPKGCARVYYKPNNPQFAQQGGVDSSTRILKLNVNTIESAAASQQRLRGRGAGIGTPNELANGVPPFTPFIYKDKTNLVCQPQTYVGNPFFFQGQHQNKLVCNARTNGAEYHTNVSLYQRARGNYIGATQP